VDRRAHLVYSKISALTCQVFAWYGLVFLTEAIVGAVYRVQWCNEFDFHIDPLLYLQKFVDAIL